MRIYARMPAAAWLESPRLWAGPSYPSGHDTAGSSHGITPHPHQLQRNQRGNGGWVEVSGGVYVSTRPGQVLDMRCQPLWRQAPSTAPFHPLAGAAGT